MASRRSTAAAAATPASGHAHAGEQALPDWMERVTDQGVRPEQALALIGVGLMRRLAQGGGDPTWLLDVDEEACSADLVALRQRLELTRLAIETGAPLSTAEVTHLLGARPGGELVERGGLTARRLRRNVWRLQRREGEADRTSYGFSESFRRRL
jgi:hypothetical protein